MRKKILFTLLAALIGFNYAQAQDFEFLYDNPTHDTTVGISPYVPGSNTTHDYVEVRQYITNISTHPYTVSWNYIDVDTTVNLDNKDSILDHWFVTGICDNINCRGEFGPWYFGNAETSAQVDPDGNMMIEIRVYVPNSSPDTTRTFKVQLKTFNQTDTAVFVITKDGNTGISALRLDDNRVSLYPNPLPAGQDLNIYVDKSLNATEAVIYSIIGQKQMVLPLNKSNEVHSLNTGKLPAGMYFVKVTDKSGNVIASRKFAKQ